MVDLVDLPLKVQRVGRGRVELECPKLQEPLQRLVGRRVPNVQDLFPQSGPAEGVVAHFALLH